MARDAERIDRLEQAMRDQGLDGVVCTLAANVLLVSGYWPVVGTSIALANRDGRVALVVPEDEKELAGHGGADEVFTFQSGSLDEVADTLSAVRGVFEQAFRRLGLDRGTVGCEGGAHFEPVSYAAMHLYGAAIFELITGSLRSGSIAPADALFERARCVKTPIELDRIRRACRIAGVAFEHGASHIRPGLKETEASAYFRTQLYTCGTGFEGVARADGFVFCMSGRNAGSAWGAYARSRAREICVADLVLTHCNSYADGYWTDITRTYSMGAPEEKQRRMFEAVFAAREAALDTVRPGARAADVDRAARGEMRRRGFENEFKHPTGHGVGFAAINHNACPRLHPKSSDTLEAGMVFNVEPGIYFENWGGMRHCDMVAVTENGAELLTPFQTSIEECIR